MKLPTKQNRIKHFWIFMVLQWNMYCQQTRTWVKKTVFNLQFATLSRLYNTYEMKLLILMLKPV